MINTAKTHRMGLLIRIAEQHCNAAPAVGNAVTGKVPGSSPISGQRTLQSGHGDSRHFASAHPPKNPKLQAEISKQASISPASSRRFRERCPDGYSRLYSRWSRRVFSQYQPSVENWSSFGSFSLTLSAISKLARADSMPQAETHTSATMPITTRGATSSSF